jgi:hypothetical protein
LDRKIKLKTIKFFIKELKKIEIKREYKKIIKTIIKIIFNGSKHPSQKKKKKPHAQANKTTNLEPEVDRAL